MRGRVQGLFLLMLLVLGSVACGKKGPPLPPLRPVLPVFANTEFRQRGADVLIDWSVHHPAGQGSKAEIVKFVVRRAAAGDTEEVAEAEESLLRKTLEPIATLEPAQVAFGSGYRFRDEGAAGSGRHWIYTLGIVTGVKGREVQGPLYRFHASDAPAPVEGAEAVAVPGGIQVSWAGGEGEFASRIYRVSNDQVVPVSMEPESGSASYLDTEVLLESSYNYRIVQWTELSEGQGLETLGTPEEDKRRAPWEAAVLQVESAPSPAVEATYLDLYPPPTPENLRAFPEPGVVVLLWNPVEAEDLLGYHVFRGAPGDDPTAFVRLTSDPQKDTVYRDATAETGRTYLYSVQSLDRQSPPNLSPLSTTASVTASR